jgi:DNA-binding NarL/FixJ family response regulator
LTPCQPTSIVVICRHDKREELFDELLADPHDFDMIFVESIARGFARIKELRPDLVVVFTAMNDQESFQLLSMLAIDDATSRIPVVTYAAPRDHQRFDRVAADIEDRMVGGLPSLPN